MIVQKLQLNGHPRPASKHPRAAGVALDVFHRQERQRPAFHPRQVGHVVINRQQAILEGGEQQLVEPVLRFAREQGDPECERVFHLGRHLRQHREASADVESSDRDLDSGLAQLASDIDRACELVGLHSDQHHDATIRIALEPPNYRRHRDFSISLVVRFDIQIDALAEDAPRLRVERESVEVRQRARRHKSAPPLY